MTSFTVLFSFSWLYDMFDEEICKVKHLVFGLSDDSEVLWDGKFNVVSVGRNADVLCRREGIHFADVLL
jgi:hypothetical protein